MVNNGAEVEYLVAVPVVAVTAADPRGGDPAERDRLVRRREFPAAARARVRDRDPDRVVRADLCVGLVLVRPGD